MKIDKRYKLESVTDSKAISKPYAGVIKLTKNHAIVTDGHSLAVVPITRDETDTATYLSPELLTKARRLAGKSRFSDTVTIDDLNGTGKLSDGSIVPNVNYEDTYPALKVFPTGEKKMTISFNARILADLADALGTDEVVMDVYERNQGRFNGEVFKVRPMGNTENKAHGLLMGVARE